MFKIYANGNFVNEALGYGNALKIAKKAKQLFSNKKAIVIIEDIKGRIVDTL